MIPLAAFVPAPVLAPALVLVLELELELELVSVLGPGAAVVAGRNKG